mgnify:CR=1 FL=1
MITIAKLLVVVLLFLSISILIMEGWLKLLSKISSVNIGYVLKKITVIIPVSQIFGCYVLVGYLWPESAIAFFVGLFWLIFFFVYLFRAFLPKYSSVKFAANKK